MASKKGLLDLPPEIWSKIGKLVIDESPRCDKVDLNESMHRYITGPHQPAITRTCRALREELLPYFYCTKVELDVNGSDFIAIPDLEKRVGRSLRAIGSTNRQDIGLVRCEIQKRRGQIEKITALMEQVWGVPFELVLLGEGRFEDAQWYRVVFL